MPSIISCKSLWICMWLVPAYCVAMECGQPIPRNACKHHTEAVSSQQLISEALQNSAEVGAAFRKWKSTIAKISYADTLPDPKLTFGHFIQQVETRVGPQRQRISASQMIPWWDKLRLRRSVAVRDSLLAEQALNIASIRVAEKLQSALLDLYLIRETQTITRDNITLVEILETVARRKVSVGGSAADSLQAQIEINKLRDDLLSLEQTEIATTAHVNAILNRASPCKVVVPANLFSDIESRVHSIDSVNLLEVNPNLAYLCLEVQRNANLQHLVHQDRYPDVTLGVNWINTGRAIANTKDNGKDPLSATISINVPIWRNAYSAKEREAAQNVLVTERHLAQQEYTVEAELANAEAMLSNSQRQVQLYLETLIPEAEQALGIIQEAYESGSQDFERLLQSERMLLYFKLEYEKAKVQAAKQQVRISALFGNAY